MKHRAKILIAGDLLALTLFGVATAGPLEDGNAAYQRGDYATAMRLWRPLADHGSAEAQDNLGDMYGGGRGVAQDYAQAAVWYRKAADQGLAVAQENLGIMYEEGWGVAQDYALAVMWYRKAAEQGRSLAQTAFVETSLGDMYYYGNGVPQDYAQAVVRYRTAADHGNTTAQANLGFMYANGQGVPQDYTQAHMWLNLAAAGEVDAAIRDRDVKYRDKLAAKMSPDQIAEAQRMAREWVPK